MGRLLAWFLDKIRGLIGLFLPAVGKVRGAPDVGKGVRWALHILVVAAILVGLWFLNQLPDVLRQMPGTYEQLRHNWLPLLFAITYVLCWLGWWLWTLLVTEDEHAEFSDITEAWDEARAALEKAGFDLREMPLFLIVGRTESGLEPMHFLQKFEKSGYG
jgi:hypothetical protein